MLQDQASSSDAAFFQGDWHRVHGSLLPPHSGVRRGAVGEDHRRLLGPVPLVRGRQKEAFSSMDQTGRPRATPTSHLQVVPGNQ